MPDELEDLTDEMKAAIGQSNPPVMYEVSAPGIRLFARAIGYKDPVYYDEDEAKKRGHGALPAPGTQRSISLLRRFLLLLLLLPAWGSACVSQTPRPPI